MPACGKSKETEMDFVVDALITGIGATAVMDLWAIVRRRLFSVPLPNYSMLGRWVAHMAAGRFTHESRLPETILGGAS